MSRLDPASPRPTTVGRAARPGPLMAAIVLAAIPRPALAQVLQGRVLDEDNGRPVGTALIRLLDPQGKPLTVAVADSLGRYRLELPAPGSYLLSAERLGYHPFTSHLMSAEDSTRTYPVDIGMHKAPVPLSGIVVTAERFEEVRRGIRLEIGVNTKSLRFQPIMRPTIQAHIDKGHDLTELIRWSNLPSVVVHTSTEGPCFQYRHYKCLEVYLDGTHVNPEFVPTLPLDLVETIVVVSPQETIAYPGGAILLYTAGWIK